jgi:hypothetical protein
MTDHERCLYRAAEILALDAVAQASHGVQVACRYRPIQASPYFFLREEGCAGCCNVGTYSLPLKLLGDTPVAAQHQCYDIVLDDRHQ